MALQGIQMQMQKHVNVMCDLALTVVTFLLEKRLCIYMYNKLYRWKLELSALQADFELIVIALLSCAGSLAILKPQALITVALAVLTKHRDNTKGTLSSTPTPGFMIPPKIQVIL